MTLFPHDSQCLVWTRVKQWLISNELNNFLHEEQGLKWRLGIITHFLRLLFCALWCLFWGRYRWLKTNIKKRSRDKRWQHMWVRDEWRGILIGLCLLKYGCWTSPSRKELSRKTKLSIYWSVYVPTLNLLSQSVGSDWKNETANTNGRKEFPAQGDWDYP